MLNLLELTRSRLRKKILSYFFTNPSAKLYLRETASILGEDAGNLSKELTKLEQAGVFISALRGNQKYFSLNKKCPLYKELRSIIFKTIGVEGSLNRIVNEVAGIEAAFIYGSFAMNKENSVSDIDLFILGNPDEDSLMAKIDILEKKLHREINYNIHSRKEFREKVRKKDSFIMNVLKGSKLILKGSLDEIQ